MASYSHPIDGWSAAKFSKASAGPATNDFMGQLYCHLQSLVRSFYRHLSAATVDFTLLNVGVEDLKLKEYSQGKKFARIEVSYLSDV